MSNQKPVIRIYDDVERHAGRWRRKLEKVAIVDEQFALETISTTTFEELLIELHNRQKDFRNRKKIDYGECLLDRTDILILDDDLVQAKNYMTAEIAARLVRCFSRCSLIVGVNRFGTNHFDLLMRGYPDSFCDLHVGEKQLANPGLWGEDRIDFRPWHWPQLIDYLADFKRKVEDVLNHPKAHILKHFGFERMPGSLPLDVAKFLGSKPEDTTFQSFPGTSPYALGRRDAAAYRKNPNEIMMAHIAVGKISRWLEHMVMPRQDILVNAPHLVLRYPSLILNQEGLEDRRTWNKTTRFDYDIQLGIDIQNLEDYIFPQGFWLSRPAWFWNRVVRSQRIHEEKQPWTHRRYGFVFCEDSSKFYAVSDSRRFQMGLETPFYRRFVHKHNGVRYTPIDSIVD